MNMFFSNFVNFVENLFTAWLLEKSKKVAWCPVFVDNRLRKF